jgi:hypothetical protein
MYPPNIANVATIIHIKRPLGHVFGVAAITVLVGLSSFSLAVLLSDSSLASSVLYVQSDQMVNLIWSHPSHGIIHTF